MTENLLSLIAVTTASLVPVHQGLVEAYKSLSGLKLRRYFEAIAEIVYGPGYRGAGSGDPAALGLVERFVGIARLVPAELGAERRRKWVEGAQRRLIEGFLIRGVGDSPSPDISEQDIENVVGIIREESSASVRETARRLRLLRAHGAAGPADAALVLETIPADDPEVQQQLKTWAGQIRKLTSPSAVDVALESYYHAFVEQFLPREHTARLELPNALKSAELRYHQDLLRSSVFLAALEGVLIGRFVSPGTAWESFFAGIAAAASLFVLSQGSKGLLDAVIGLGSRLRG